MAANDSRRVFLLSTAAAGMSLLSHACRGRESAVERIAPTGRLREETDCGVTDEKVTAVEDLMREHGVIRRVLVLYRESAMRLRSKSFPQDVLQKAAKLIRTFGEDYHEKLEETHIFPVLKNAAGSVPHEIETLLAQHQRGREVTDYILAVTHQSIGAVNIEPFARVLNGFARMYESHAAREDTIVFPAWKETLSKRDMEEMGEMFEDIEHRTFGRDGFEDAVDQVGALERELGLDPAVLTAPAPKS